ncbi:MAG: hypothetical protein ABSE82_06215 [Nitrososphaerales archaeon]|jgi:hypothetical protein
MKADLLKISTLFPEAFEAASLTASGVNPLVNVVNLLCRNDVQTLPLVPSPEPRINPETKIKEYASLASYAVLDSILRSDFKNYQLLVFSTKCQEVAVWIGSLRSTDSLDELMRVLEMNGFGNAIVEQEDARKNVLLTLKDIVSLYQSERLRSTLLVSDVSSPKVSASTDTTITETLSLMLNKGARRLFLQPKNAEEEENYSGLQFVSDRGILSFLFTPQRLEILKKSPESWLDARICDVGTSSAVPVACDATINQASQLIGEKPDGCLVCEESQEVVSRWDIAMKPWQVDSLEISA